MRKYVLLAATAAIAALPAAPTLAQGDAAAEAAVLEPEASAALDAMGAYLRTLTAFEVKVDSTREDVLEDGQKLQYIGHARYLYSGPNKLFAETKSDSQNRKFYYDGANFTIFSPKTGYYAQTAATGTVGNLVAEVTAKYGIEFPIQDLFRWGNPNAAMDRPSEGTVVGPALIGNWMTTHYAFRQQGADFQIWIDDGDKPFPRKLVITDTEDPARPQYVAYLRWNTDKPPVESTSFTFTPGPNAKRIPLQVADATQNASN